jgi:serine protease Do
MSLPRLLLCVVLVFALVGRGAAQRDLRDQFGTKSLETARQLAEAIKLSQAKKYKEALTAVQAAVKADPRCQMAHFWHGLILANLGEIPESIAAYKKALSNSVARSPKISAITAVNLAITLGKLEEYDESSLWFTRAILEDPGNANKQRGKAYRNLSITLTRQGQHLAAAFAMTMALKDKFPGVTEETVVKLFEKGDEQESASLLYFPAKVPALAKRTEKTTLSAVDLKADIDEPIFDILSDPEGRYLVALPRNAAHYYLIGLAGKVSVAKVPVKTALASGYLAEGALYAAANNPARIDQMEVATGKVIKTYPLKIPVPTSLVVYPHPAISPDGKGRGSAMAYFPLGSYVHGLNLQTGGVFKSEVPGHAVAGHPGQRFVYSYVRSNRTRWRQAMLARAVTVPGGLLLAGVRGNAASNAAHMEVSPDGDWVAVAGGGGWRPETKQASGTGYGVAVFSAQDVGRLHGFFPIDPYPLGVCFNPVTQQVAVIRAQDARVYHLADAKENTTITGQFTGVGAWSGNGRYVALGNTGKGLTLVENSLSAAEVKLAGTWWKPWVVKFAARPVASFPVVAALTRFAVKSPTRAELAAALAKSVAEGRTDKPARWQEYPEYLKKVEVRKAVDKASEHLKDGGEFGIAIFQLKKALKNHPEAVPLKFFLAEALRRGNQPKEAEKFYLAVVQGDAGRTEFSFVALNQLALLLDARNETVSALDCLAASLLLDRANPGALALAIRLLKKQKFDAEAAQFAKAAAALPAASDPVAVQLPKLPKPAADAKAYKADELYRKAVASVVLIKTRTASGSGVCVGKADFILTNHHVIDGEGPIAVFPFTYKDDTLVRLPEIRATVVFQSEKDDVAILKLEKAAQHLEPLAIAAAVPAAGTRVYAIGSPGLGKEVLEQSISEGIIGARKRLINGQPYLQHTAAVNPGNSGGPLINEKCQLVGIVTLKARLDKVSFAIPVDKVRAIFKSP